MTKDEEVQMWMDRLDGMNQEELAKLQRFAPAGHPVFDCNLPLYAHFQSLFKGMTSEISKAIGWER